MKILISLILMAGVASGLIIQEPREGKSNLPGSVTAGSNLQQDLATGASMPFMAREAPPFPGGSRTGLVGMQFGQSMSEAQREAEQALRKATLEFKKADSSTAKRDAKTALRKALQDVYDERLENYKVYLEKLRDRIREMEDRLEKRADVRDEMVDLRLMMMEHEADGLGWPERNPPGYRNLWGSSRSLGPFVTPSRPSTPRSVQVRGGSTSRSGQGNR